jgi:lipopolysaccharide exporter
VTPGAPGSTPVAVPTTTPSALRNRTVSGVRVTLVAQVCLALLQLGYAAVAARLLTDVDFGVIATIQILFRLVLQFANLGLGAAIVQAPTVTQDQARSAHALATLVGAGLASIVALSAPLLTSVLPRHPQSGSIVRVLSLTVLMVGMSAVPVGLLRRRHAFTALAAIDVVSYVLGYPVLGLLCAAHGMGPMSLALALVTQMAITLLLSLVLVRGTLPPWPVSPAGGRIFAAFGTGVSLISFIEFWASSLDIFLVSRVLGPGPTGQYTRASYLVWLPAQQLGVAINRVMLSTAARFRQAQMATRVLDGLEYLAAVLMVGLVFAALTAHPLVRLLLGPHWEQVPQLLPIMSLAVGLNTLNAWLGVSYEALGLLRMKGLATVGKLAVMVFGLSGVAWLDRQNLWAYAAVWAAAELTLHLTFLSGMRRLGVTVAGVVRSYRRAIGAAAAVLAPAALVSWALPPVAVGWQVAVPAVVLLVAVSYAVLRSPACSLGLAARLAAPGLMARWGRETTMRGERP